jgi:hypothetical protein
MGFSGRSDMAAIMCVLSSSMFFGFGTRCMVNEDRERGRK